VWTGLKRVADVASLIAAAHSRKF